MEVYVLAEKQKSLWIKTIILACFVIGFMCMFYAFLGYFVFILLGFPCLIIALLLKNLSMEYEYSYYDGELRFARIINKSYRKELETYHMKDVEQLICIGGDGPTSVFYAGKDKIKVKDLTTGTPGARIYGVVVNKVSGTEIIKFEPDEKYLNEVCVKYGYKVHK